MSRNFYGIEVLLVDNKNEQTWKRIGDTLGEPLLFEKMDEAQQFLEKVWPLLDGKDIRVVKTDEQGDIIEENPLE